MLFHLVLLLELLGVYVLVAVDVSQHISGVLRQHGVDPWLVPLLLYVCFISY